MSVPLVDMAETFWSRVEKTDSCWLWRGAIGSGGYGTFSFRRVTYRAHRIAFVLAGGAIPLGLQLDHLCRVRACVNPSHLQVVTQRENILRGVSPIADYAKRTHCPKGHPYDMAYTYPSGKRCRACVACRRERIKAWKLAHPERVKELEKRRRAPGGSRSGQPFRRGEKP